MSFEHQMICDALNGAEIEFEMNDICNVEADSDRVYFNLTGESKGYVIRMWDMNDWDEKVVIEYTLYKDNEIGTTDMLFDSVFIKNK